jgi:stage II sporulation protein D
MVRKRVAPILCSLVAAAVVTAPASAGRPPRRPAGHFVFHGSGYGHGIGMSQYGALGLARRGWPAGKIVRHYYRGVTVAPRPPAEPTIKVGLLQHAGSARVISTAGPFDLVLQAGGVVETVPDGQRRTVEVTGDKRFRILRPDGTEVGVVGGPGNDLIARLHPGSRMRVPEWGHELGHGEARFQISGPGTAHVLAALAVEDYVLGISEVPNSWPAEALGAQAIASRTYGYWRLAGALRVDCACDVYTSTADQVYVGWDKEASPQGERWIHAVRATERTVAAHQGQPIYAAYSSSSGGYTEDIEKVWPGATPHAYLRGVCDPGDDVQDNPNRFWRTSLQAGAVTGDLRPYTGDIGTVTRFADWNLGVSGRVTSVRVVGTEGASMVQGWDIRSGLTLKDTRFSVNRNLNVTGRIRDEYDSVGCRPGRATAAQKKVPGGREQRFVNGRMYENGRRNAAVWLRGAVLGEYLRRTGPAGRLGLPYRYKKVKHGAKALFDRGTITCSPRCRVRFR